MFYSNNELLTSSSTYTCETDTVNCPQTGYHKLEKSVNDVDMFYDELSKDTGYNCKKCTKTSDNKHDDYYIYDDSKNMIKTEEFTKKCALKIKKTLRDLISEKFENNYTVSTEIPVIISDTIISDKTLNAKFPEKITIINQIFEFKNIVGSSTYIVALYSNDEYEICVKSMQYIGSHQDLHITTNKAYANEHEVYNKIGRELKMKMLFDDKNQLIIMDVYSCDLGFFSNMVDNYRQNVLSLGKNQILFILREIAKQVYPIARDHDLTYLDIKPDNIFARCTDKNVEIIMGDIEAYYGENYYHRHHNGELLTKMNKYGKLFYSIIQFINSYCSEVILKDFGTNLYTIMDECPTPFNTDTYGVNRNASDADKKKIVEIVCEVLLIALTEMKLKTFTQVEYKKLYDASTTKAK